MAIDLSIIIVNWNTRDQLRDCLGALAAASADMRTEIFVVDNASADGSDRMVRTEFPACQLLPGGGNLGFSRAVNLGLERAGGEQVLLLNPDTICPAGSLTRLAGFLAGTEDGAAVGPTLVDAAGRPTATSGDFPAVRHHLLSCLDPGRVWLPGRLRQAGLGRVPGPGAVSGPVDYVKGACLLIKRQALQQVGPLDERFFMYFEETDWCWRARAAGWRVYHCAEVAVKHLEGAAAAQVSDFCRAQLQTSYRLFVAKHYGPGRVWQFRAAQFLEYLGKGLLRLLTPGNRSRNRALSRAHLATAGLQLRDDIAPVPPA